jgi:hypothetical protein
MYINNKSAILLLVGAILTTALFTTYTAQAETGKGTDVFRVIMTVFGVDKSKGDVVAIVTVNNGEASKVKFLDIDTLQSSLITSAPSTTNPAVGGGIIEYVATFPNITVNAGEQYEACILPVKNLELICTTGSNSPAHRPEFVDLSLNATSEVEQAIRQEENSEDGNDED